MSGYVYSDGGREAAGFKGTVGDCACRAVAIATGLPYREVYDLLNRYAKTEKLSKQHRGKSSARNGYHSATLRVALADLGWSWKPTMRIGEGCTVHLTASELPAGRLIVRLSKHYCAAIDGVVYDTHDPRRDGRRCVYGYWFKPMQVGGPDWTRGPCGKEDV